MKETQSNKEFPRGGYILNPGNAAEYQTGEWRSMRPVWDKDKCINCMFCWLFCPDLAIIVEEGKVKGIDYKYCKGCGICSHECPDRAKAIRMIKEGEQEDRG